MPAKKSITEQFKDKFIVDPSGCWLWTGHADKCGYGRVNNKACGHLGHRMSWIIHKGAIPNGLWVLHKCDVPGCVNPDHLFLGTCKDNSDDMIRKGRARHEGQPGESNACAKLSERDVREIRRLRETGMYLHDIAKIFHTHKSNIDLIVRRVTWSHI